ncbi:uncharacterized protein LOC128072908 [Tympanuchus pallidicinctus]|uniref:uncharacterized protein LOC128072908 n=1 Tax=Tympanuchus pallidicinctus TaxID=109042 RepID=UPI0022872BA5|nr:uncharacterized protein LOC128072908 [Tympanuchus pallidicinctus]XP_052523093.1 uncharacterized protein LOC128072908 [Tympanuchus pallidicinctus]
MHHTSIIRAGREFSTSQPTGGELAVSQLLTTAPIDSVGLRGSPELLQWQQITAGLTALRAVRKDVFCKTPKLPTAKEVGMFPGKTGSRPWMSSYGMLVKPNLLYLSLFHPHFLSVPNSALSPFPPHPRFPPLSAPPLPCLCPVFAPPFPRLSPVSLHLPLSPFPLSPSLSSGPLFSFQVPFFLSIPPFYLPFYPPLFPCSPTLPFFTCSPLSFPIPRLLFFFLPPSFSFSPFPPCLPFPFSRLSLLFFPPVFLLYAPIPTSPFTPFTSFPPHLPFCPIPVFPFSFSPPCTHSFFPPHSHSFFRPHRPLFFQS